MIYITFPIQMFQHTQYYNIKMHIHQNLLVYIMLYYMVIWFKWFLILNYEIFYSVILNVLSIFYLKYKQLVELYYITGILI